MSINSHINNSGFPLQLAVKHAVKSSNTGWRVLYEEHFWEREGLSGFVDLVIVNPYGTILMNIECKRVRDSNWVFLADKGIGGDRKLAKIWATYYNNDSVNYFDWVDIPVTPRSVESKYSIVAGQDGKAQPMLERIAAVVVQSTEALAHDERNLLKDQSTIFRLYVNVIVTTADLYVLRVDPAEADLATGEISKESESTKVPYVRFRKQLNSSYPEEPLLNLNQPGLPQIAIHRESTVFIVNSLHFMDFVKEFELPDDIAFRLGSVYR